MLEQVPPPQPGLPRPRFSLYLSSQLQYGVVVVFHRQCGILLGESPLFRITRNANRTAFSALFFGLFRGTSVHRGTAGQAEDVQKHRYGGPGEVRASVKRTRTRSSFHSLHHVLFCVRHFLDVPDALSLQQETEGAPNPLFGVMRDMGLSSGVFFKVPWSKKKNTRVSETRARKNRKY